jgi:hypothetical protein
VTDDTTPGDGTHELNLPERQGVEKNTPPTPAQPDTFTWGLRPRGPDRSSAPPTAAIILPSFVQPPESPAPAPSAAPATPASSAAPASSAVPAVPAEPGAPAPKTRPAAPTSRRARITEPTEPPALVEPPVPAKRNYAASELATQAMSLEEILAAQAATPVMRETWSRPVPTQSGAATPPAGDPAQPVRPAPSSRRVQLAKPATADGAEAAAITSLPAALAPATPVPATSTHRPSDSATSTAATSATASSTPAASAASAPAPAPAADDPELSTQALTAQDVADAETPRVRPRRAHLPEGVHDRHPAPESVTVAASFRQPASPVLPQLPAARGASTGIQRSAMSASMPNGQKVLLWIAGSLVMVLVLVATYLLAARLGEQSVTANEGATVSADADVTPALEGDEAPLEPGVHEWSALVGSECLTDFDNAWAEEFTVVACDTDHTAQMLARGELSAGSDAPFPGVDTLTTDVGVLCSLPSVLNFGQANATTDIQVSSSFPVDAAAWATGDRTYFCFVERASGESLPGDLQVVPAA